jgi:3'-phosphoadenosine 5'-phosphosulfate sulfotransferase (PAPS reductase)/FAD synthetase
VTRAIDTSRIGARRVVASVSGGKDSAAMCLALMDAGIEHDRVFIDTGWEHPATYEYIRGTLTDRLGPITEIRGDLLMSDLIRKKAMVPTRTRRYCTRLLKVQPMQRHLAARPDEVVNATGIRRAESRARSQMAEWEWSEGFDCEVWRPILMWSEQDVIDIHARHGLAPNPLYLQGARRVGCWPCIMASKSEIRLLADMDPKRVDEIRSLENELTAKAGSQRAWFQAKGALRNAQEPLTCPACNGEAGKATSGEDTLCERCGGVGTVAGWTDPPVPIDAVVAWSRTSHGGRQTELFAPSDRDEGCMRWGLCDTTIDKEANHD